MHQGPAESDQPSGPDADRAAKQERLYQFLEDEKEASALLGILRSYVRNAGLATGQAVQDVAYEVLSDVMVEALPRLDRFDPARSPRAWLLGFAINIIKRRKARAGQAAREVPMREAAGPAERELSDDEIFDRLAAIRDTDLSADVAANESAATLLMLVGEEDRRILHLAVLAGMDGAALGRALGVKPATARVRLHRALDRLREAWRTHMEGSR